MGDKKMAKKVEKTVLTQQLFSSKVLAVILVALIIVSGILFVYLAPAAGGKPVHSDAEAKKVVDTYLKVYYGLFDISPSATNFRAGVWNVETTASSELGASNLLVTLNDSTLQVIGVYDKEDLLEKPLGIVNITGKAACNTTSKPEVMEFVDWYDGFSVQNEPSMEALRARFGDGISFSYHVLLTGTDALEKRFGGNVSLFSKYFICAQAQSADAAQKMKQCFINRYTPNGEPLNESAIQACADFARLDNSTLGTCLQQTAPNVLRTDLALATTYFPDRLATPTVMINCNWRTKPKLAEFALCWALPGTTGC